MGIVAGHNLWWRLKRVQPEYIKPVKRTVFREALSILQSDRSVRRLSIVGPHRCGKTVVLHQLIDALLERGVAPRRILYIDMNHPFFTFFSLEEICQYYRENIYSDETQRVYFFIDDVQLLPDWEKELEQLCAAEPNVFVVSSGTILPGKKTDGSVLLHLPPMSFFEYCQLAAGTERIAEDADVPDHGLLRASAQELRNLAKSLSFCRSRFMNYINTGGFPKLVMEQDEVLIMRMLEGGVVSEGILRDMPTCFRIRGAADLEKLYLFLCFQCPGVVSFDALARQLDCVTRPTVDKYISFLERSSLIYTCRPVESLDRSEAQQKIQPKIYLMDHAVRNAMVVFDNTRLSYSDLRRSVETMVYRHLRFFGPDSEEGRIYYQREKTAGKKLDMILLDSKRLHVDIRYGDPRKVTSRDAILAANHRADICLLITQNDAELGRIPGGPGNVFRIPAHIFLFLIGMAKNEGSTLFSSGLL